MSADSAFRSCSPVPKSDSPNLPGNADQVINAVREHLLEGVVAKRIHSLCEPGKRTGNWVKLPCKQTAKYIIVGFRLAGRTLSVLLVGQYHDGKFRFAGKVRLGHNAAGRTLLLDALKPLVARKSPFADLPNVKKAPFHENVTPEEMPSFLWVKPEIEIPVQFTALTTMGTLRHPELHSLE